MFRYVFRRLLISIPTLLVISLAVFGLGKCAPGDAVQTALGDDLALVLDPPRYAATYQRKAAQMGLDAPLFYCSFSQAAFPDSLWKIYPLERRKRLSKIVAQNGNWQATRAFEDAVNQAILEVDAHPTSPAIEYGYLRLAILDLSAQYRLDDFKHSFQRADSLYRNSLAPLPQIDAQLAILRGKITAVCDDVQQAKLITPALHWYGLNNQYHHWLTGFVGGNWGMTKKQVPVWQELKPALFATLSINFLAMFFAYLIAIPLGVEMARRKGSAFDRWGQRVLIFLTAMPVFWLGGLLVLFFCSPIFGKPFIANPYLDISDAWSMNSEPFLTWFSIKLPKFVLPIIVLTLYSLVVLTMQMRGGMLETLGQDYIRTARAKGVREDDIHWSHAFRNAVFPIITIFASVFPMLFTGSLVLETMFNFPGVGQKVQYAFLSEEMSILSAILMAAAVMTVVGNLIADLLYAWVDPRVRYVGER